MQTPQAFQAVMNSAQAAFDNMAPPDYDEDALTEEQAIEQAEGELHLNAYAIVENLQFFIGDEDTEPLPDRLLNDVHNYPAGDTDLTELPESQLLILALQTSPAGRELLGRLRVLVQSDIAARADELMGDGGWGMSTTPHKWASVIHAWKDGKVVQCVYAGGSAWTDWNDAQFARATPEFNSIHLEWRIKPEVVRYRVALCQLSTGLYFTNTADEPTRAGAIEQSSTFVRWIGDWQEVEA
jgi:hypothetical protein